MEWYVHDALNSQEVGWMTLVVIELGRRLDHRVLIGIQWNNPHSHVDALKNVHVYWKNAVYKRRLNQLMCFSLQNLSHIGLLIGQQQGNHEYCIKSFNIHFYNCWAVIFSKNVIKIWDSFTPGWSIVPCAIFFFFFTLSVTNYISFISVCHSWAMVLCIAKKNVACLHSYATYCNPIQGSIVN